MSPRARRILLAINRSAVLAGVMGCVVAWSPVAAQSTGEVLKWCRAVSDPKGQPVHVGLCIGFIYAVVSDHALVREALAGSGPAFLHDPLLCIPPKWTATDLANTVVTYLERHADTAGMPAVATVRVALGSNVFCASGR